MPTDSMKYIITDHNKVVLGSGTLHYQLAGAVTGVVVGAGWVDLSKGEIYGKSSGFGRKATQEDAEYLTNHLGIPIKLQVS